MHRLANWRERDISRDRQSAFRRAMNESRISCDVSRRGSLRRAARSSSRKVIYWRTIWPRVVIGTTHLRAAKWPLPDFDSRKRDNKFRFAARAAPSAFNLTGRNLVTLVSDKRRMERKRGGEKRVADPRLIFFRDTEKRLLRRNGRSQSCVTRIDI